MLGPMGPILAKKLEHEYKLKAVTLAPGELEAALAVCAERFHAAGAAAGAQVVTAEVQGYDLRVVIVATPQQKVAIDKAPLPAVQSPAT